MNAITKYLASIGAKGGAAKSKAKTKAAKTNGKLGGRPKKTPKVKKRPSSGSNDEMRDGERKTTATTTDQL